MAYIIGETFIFSYFFCTYKIEGVIVKNDTQYVTTLLLAHYNISSNTAGPAYYVLYLQKGITICVFLTYPAFRNLEGNVSQTNLALMSGNKQKYG